MAMFKSVLISGASSGIGAALALECAAPGVSLHLGGRDAGRLDAVAAACRARGATVQARATDVCDAAAARCWVEDARPLDLVIANAGIGGGIDGGGPEAPAQVRAILGVNLDGALNVVLPALELMAKQPPDANGVRGRIAAVASVAAFVPAPGAPAYAASKAALDMFVVATAPSAHRVGIRLTSVCPGYIRTAMTADNPFPMPGLMDAGRAARIILAGVRAGRRRIAFPWWIAVSARIVGLLPPSVSGALLSRSRGKPPRDEALPLSRPRSSDT